MGVFLGAWKIMGLENIMYIIIIVIIMEAQQMYYYYFGSWKILDFLQV